MIKLPLITIALTLATTPVMAQPIAWNTANFRIVPQFGNPAKSLEQRASDAMDDLRTSEAIALLDKAIAQDPSNPQLKQQLFTALHVGGTNTTQTLPLYSIGLLVRAVRMKPEVSNIWSSLGAAHCTLADDIRYRAQAESNVRKCIAFYKKAIELTDYKPQVLYKFGVSMAPISPVFAAQVFDLGVREYLRKGDRDGARGMVVAKQAILGR